MPPAESADGGGDAGVFSSFDSSLVCSCLLQISSRRSVTAVTCWLLLECAWVHAKIGGIHVPFPTGAVVRSHALRRCAACCMGHWIWNFVAYCVFASHHD
jgi:hypothetical protein